MCTTQFLQGAHNVIIDKFKESQYDDLETFYRLQKSGDLERRRKGYQKLHDDMDAHDRVVDVARKGKLLRMPLECHNAITTFLVDRVLLP